MILVISHKIHFLYRENHYEVTTVIFQSLAAGSLYPHNVILVPLGEDFTLMMENEWDNQVMTCTLASRGRFSISPLGATFDPRGADPLLF
jgi:hypothetical protein